MKLTRKTINSHVMSRIYAEKLMYLRKSVDTVFDSSLENWLREFGAESDDPSTKIGLWYKKVLQNLSLSEPNPLEVMSLVESKLERSVLELTESDFEFLKKEFAAEKDRVEQSANRIVQSALEEVFASIEPIESRRIMYRRAMKKFSSIIEKEGPSTLSILISDNPVSSVKQLFGKKTHEISGNDISHIQEELRESWREAVNLLNSLLNQKLSNLLNEVIRGDYQRWFEKQQEDPNAIRILSNRKNWQQMESVLSNKKADHNQMISVLMLNGYEPMRLLVEGLEPIESELRKIMGEINIKEKPIPESVLDSKFSVEKLIKELEKHGITDNSEILSIMYYTVKHMDDGSRKVFKQWLNTLLT